MSDICPLIGRQAKIALALQSVVAGQCPTADNPAKVTDLAKFSTSNLASDDKKVFADSLEDRASEFDGAVVGTFEPSGDIEFNAQEEGAFQKLLAMHYGDPTTVATVAAAPNAAFNTHTYKNTHAYRYGTIVEKIGKFYFIYSGARVNRLALSVRKTQDRVIFAQANIMAYNGYLNKKVADVGPPVVTDAGVDTGMATASSSPLPYFAAVRAYLRRANAAWAGASEFNFTSDAQLARTDDLDGYRAMSTYSSGKKIQCDATLYFSTDAEYKAFTGVSSSAAEAFGPGWDVIEEDIQLIIPGAIRGTVAGNDIFQPELEIGLYRGAFISPIEKQIRPEAIMLKVNIQVQHKNAQGTDSYVKLRNTISNPAAIAGGLPMDCLPANAGSPFVSV